jgi:two-component system chemotaxis sensor kinase CheA
MEDFGDDFSLEELNTLLIMFRDQSLQILDEMTEDLFTLESKGEDAECLARLRRGAHTIKGDSTCVGFDGVTQIAHKLEDFVDALVTGGMKFDAQHIDLLLNGLDEIRSALSHEEATDVPDEIVQKVVKRIEEAALDVAHEASQNVVVILDEKEQTETFAAEQEIAETKFAELSGGEARQENEVVQETVSVTQEVAKSASRDFVRVEASKIDTLLNLASEMVIARSVLGQLEPQLADVLQRNELIDKFGRARTQMDKLIAELHKSVLKIRMVTIDNVFKRFNRPMRELANETGKQVELEMYGGETELDRALVDLIYEPILHLLRNAVDHGVETAEERKLAGKDAVGKIHMRAYHEGNQVVVEVSDDGKGISTEALKEKAIATGAISEAQAAQMSEEEALEIIFIPGFSLAKRITHVSGRGIGMDAVRNAIEQLRGTVNVRSEVGVGTVFTLRMPLTLAIIRALLFSTGGQLFALPLMAVKEIVRAKVTDFTELDGFENYRLREQFISLVRPAVVLGFERRKGGSGAAMRNNNEQVYMIVVTVGNKKYGVVAESLIGDQELVIKPLDNRWVHNDALAGASVLGDGRVVLIMDAEMMFRKAIRYERGKGSEKRNYAV